MSSSGMPSASLGSGLPPEAPMSPPAQLTRMSTVPSFDSISVFIAATADLSPILPVTAASLPPCRASSFATAPRSGASPYLAGAVQAMSWMARSAPSSASRSAITRPRPRPDPVTKAILPLSSLGMRLFPQFGPTSVLTKTDRAHVGRAAPNHRQFKVNDRAVLAAFPGCAKVGFVSQPVHPRRRKARGKRPGGLGRIAVPPFGPQKAHMPRLERSRLENRGQTAMMPGEFIQNLGQRNGAVADRAADETITLVGELDAIVLEMHMGHVGGDPTGEVERRLRDGKSVASVEADADAARFLTKSDQFVAAEVLVVLDRQRPAFVGCARSAVAERRRHIGDQRLPLLAERVPITAKHSRQAVAYDLGVENAG